MKIITVRLNDNENNMLNEVCSRDKKKASEVMREALNLYCQASQNPTKELMEAENKNKQFAFAVDSLKAVLQENREKFELLKDKSEKETELYERMLRDLNFDKAGMQDLVSQLKTDIQQKQADVSFLQGKVEEIKKAGIFKRLFLKLA